MQGKDLIIFLNQNHYYTFSSIFKIQKEMQYVPS